MRPIDADDLVKKIYEHLWAKNCGYIGQDELVDGIIGNMETIETEAIIDVLQEIEAEILSSMESIVGKYNGDTPERQRPSAKIERNEGRKQCLKIIERKMRKLKDGEK